MKYELQEVWSSSSQSDYMLWCVISGPECEGSPFPNYCNTLRIVINCVVCGSVYTTFRGRQRHAERSSYLSTTWSGTAIELIISIKLRNELLLRLPPPTTSATPSFSAIQTIRVDARAPAVRRKLKYNIGGSQSFRALPHNATIHPRNSKSQTFS